MRTAREMAVNTAVIQSTTNASAIFLRERKREREREKEREKVQCAFLRVVGKANATLAINFQLSAGPPEVIAY